MLKAGYTGEAVVRAAIGLLSGVLVEESGIEEPVSNTELLFDALAEMLEYDITGYRVSLEWARSCSVA